MCNHYVGQIFLIYLILFFFFVFSGCSLLKDTLFGMDIFSTSYIPVKGKYFNSKR